MGKGDIKTRKGKRFAKSKGKVSKKLGNSLFIDQSFFFV